MDTRRSSMLTAALAALALLAAACGTDDGNGLTPPNGEPTNGEPPPEETQVTLYYATEADDRFWLAPEHHTVEQQPGIARATLELLLTAEPQDPAHFSVFPEGTEILGVDIENGVATVDWNARVLEANVGAELEIVGIQSVVWTLTEFDGVSQVVFLVEGAASGEASTGRVIEDWWGHVGLEEQPFERVESIRILEPITIWTPRHGDHVGHTFVLEGEASVFEATVSWRLVDATGALVQEGFTTAGVGAPERGSFNTLIEVEDPPDGPEEWRLEVFEADAADGSDRGLKRRTIIVG